MDTPFRRIVDGVVDHAVVGRVAYEVGKKNPSAIPYIGIIAARAAFAAGVAIATAPAHFKNLGVKRDGIYREL